MRVGERRLRSGQKPKVHPVPLYPHNNSFRGQDFCENNRVRARTTLRKAIFLWERGQNYIDDGSLEARTTLNNILVPELPRG